VIWVFSCPERGNTCKKDLTASVRWSNLQLIFTVADEGKGGLCARLMEGKIAIAALHVIAKGKISSSRVAAVNLD
jgi:hypothetical protein